MKKIVISAFILSILSWTTKKKDVSVLYDKAYETAFTEICKHLLDSNLIKSNHEIMASDIYTPFNMQLLSEEIRPNATDMNLVEDSLSTISASYTKASIENTAEVAFNNKSNIPSATKFILFFTRLFDDRLQAFVFSYNPKRQQKQYIQSYQGIYRTYLIKFDSNGNIDNFYNKYCLKN